LKMPQANTWFIGALPPAGAWQPGEPAELLLVADFDASHPLLQLVELEGIVFNRGAPFANIPGNRVLIETTGGPIFAVAARDGFLDAVLAAAIVTHQDGEQHFNTNWWRRESFPLLVSNVLRNLALQPSTARHGDAKNVRPGTSVALSPDSAAQQLTVTTPDARGHKVARNALGRYPFTQTDIPGIYTVTQDERTLDRFAINLLDRAESDIRPRPAREGGNVVVRIGHEEIAGRTDWEPNRREGWRWLVAFVLVIAGLEWYIYNRRVYL
jgi:hypothetical protein